jgi:hypothetical protein
LSCRVGRPPKGGDFIAVMGNLGDRPPSSAPYGFSADVGGPWTIGEQRR